MSTVDHLLYYRQALNARQSSIMTPSISDRSQAGSGNTNMRKLGPGKSTVTVNIRNHYASKVYTSGSPIEGEVTIVTKRDVRFDYIDILLVGTTQTQCDGVNTPHLVTHTFLKMPMPIPESAYPVPRVLETGQTYTFPFNFVIPQQLTINACNHQVLPGPLLDQHCRLPPTMGTLWQKDDLAPQMAQVRYSVVGRVQRYADGHGGRTRIMDAIQRIQVLPASFEDPPLNPSPADKLYKMAKTKRVRKNLLSAKLGRLTARASQPPTIFLSGDGRQASGSTVAVILEFEPTAADILPPKISSVTAKVVAHTYYSSGTISTFPNLGDWNKQIAVEKRQSYTSSVPVGSLDAKGLTIWQQRVTLSARRDSGYSSSDPQQGTTAAGGHSDSDEEYTQAPLLPQERQSSPKKSLKSSRAPKSPICHIMDLDLPISLPVDKKQFLPTFHGCIVSRVYTVQVAVTASLGSTTSTTVTLSLPLQIVVESSDGDAGLPSFEMAVEEAAIDEYLQPRFMQTYRSEITNTGGLPGYMDLANTTRPRRVAT